MMNTQPQVQDAISTLRNAFAPLACHIQAVRNGCFSFTIVNERGVARHCERLYPEQYANGSLQHVIDRTRQTLASKGLAA
ncbi:hypothetical protein C8K61_103169 [Pseudomonas sp. GV071]|jgi:hypothetical protein|nr:hypothetical protein C8K61_103169 [Pseudomonas sp. GV071]